MIELAEDIENNKSEKFLSLYYYSLQHVRKVLLSRQKKNPFAIRRWSYFSQ